MEVEEARGKSDVCGFWVLLYEATRNRGIEGVYEVGW